MVLIHLPSSSGIVQVRVTPNKIYGDKTGEELIKLYGVKYRKAEPKTIEVKGNTIFLPHGEIAEKVMFNDKTIPLKEFKNKIEQATRVKIFSKRSNRAVKHFRNTTLIIQDLDSLF